MVDKDGYLKLIDYGLAKILKAKDTTDTFCGTCEYIAPEIVATKAYDKGIDWWAVGILLYEILIGVTPFFNKNR